MRLRILGAGGHAKVALEAWRSTGGVIGALYDDDRGLHEQTILGVEIVGKTGDAIGAPDPLHVAIGDNGARRRVASLAPDDRYPAVVHVAALVSPTASLGAGTLVCAGAVVQAEARIGRHVIVNSQALVEHDVEIGDFSHVAPGVRLGGGVRIGEGVLVGIGAVVLPGIEIGGDAVIGAGAVVIRNVSAATKVVGNPARLVR